MAACSLQSTIPPQFTILQSPGSTIHPPQLTLPSPTGYLIYGSLQPAVHYSSTVHHPPQPRVHHPSSTAHPPQPYRLPNIWQPAACSPLFLHSPPSFTAQGPPSILHSSPSPALQAT